MRKVKEKFVWTIKTRRHAAKVQSPGQEAERDRRYERSGSVDPKEQCLVPDLVMPPKFKLPKFEKYDGTKCPGNHLATYCNKMAGHARNENLLIYAFYESLTEGAAQWYMKLKKDQIRTWRDLVREFLKRYKYMLETTLDRLTLQSMKKGPNEDYREYAVRWKNVASMV